MTMTKPPWKKGDKISNIPVDLVCPLFVKDSSLEQKYASLPGFSKDASSSTTTTKTTTSDATSSQHHHSSLSIAHHDALSPSVQFFINSTLTRHNPYSQQQDAILVATVVVGLHLILATPSRMDEYTLVDNDADADVSLHEEEEEDALLQEWLRHRDVVQSYNLVVTSCSSPAMQSVSLTQWARRLQQWSRRLQIVHVDHPLCRYATHEVAKLNPQDQMQVIRALGIYPNVPNKLSVLKLIKDVQDKYPPQQYAVLICDETSSAKSSTILPPHSCLPTSQLQLHVRVNHAQAYLVAMYDVATQDDLSMNRLGEVRSQDASGTNKLEDMAEERERQAMLVLGHSCCCLRCRYEVNNAGSTANQQLSVSQLVSLGRFYMGAGHFEQAATLYRSAIQLESGNLDSWHALGAAQLSLGHFLEAQRTWKDAKSFDQTNNNSSGSSPRHAGLELQWGKLDAYGYLDPEPCRAHVDTDVMDADTKQLFTSAFCSKNLVTHDMCQQILDWANTGTWTQNRHYAVPTHDVPVHTVAPLLAWFRQWMHARIRPRLAHFFGTSQYYHVHDAFVVRYQAGLASNHLPIHTDESTHSFVLALNDDYKGGGTYIYSQDKSYKLKTGQVLGFRGDRLLHGGEAVTRDVRYILAVFLYHDNDNISSEDNNTPQGKRRPASEIVAAPGKAKIQKQEFKFGFGLS